MSQRNAVLPLVLVFALIGPRSIYAQSQATTHGNTIWEADAPMAAAATSCPPSSPPQMQKQFNPDFSGWDGPPEPKNRFLSVTAGDAGQQQTIRVTWEAMPNWPGGHIALVGQQKWMTEPFQVCENASSRRIPDCGRAPGQPQKWFWAARLACAESQAWYGDLAGMQNYCTDSGEACDPNGPNTCNAGTCGVDGVIHLADSGMVPSKASPPQPATYSVQVIDEICVMFHLDGYSDPLVVINPIFGDVVAASGACPTLPANGIVDVLGDVVGAISKFSNLFCAPKKTRVDIERVSQNFQIEFTDVLQILTAFTGGPYPFAAPDPCAAAERK